MDKAAQTMIDNLEKNTGKSLEEWITVVKGSGLTKHGEIIKMLKQDHGFTHGFANLVAHKAKGSDAGSAESTDSLVEDQYKGKESLRPIYEQLVAVMQQFGADVELAPKKAYVSARRKKQFAILQPSTKSRFDLGLNLKDVVPTATLEASGSFNSMCSHRIRITSEDQVDQQMINWLKMAYEEAG